VALPFGAHNFSHSMKIGTYKKKTLKIDPQVLKISYNLLAIYDCDRKWLTLENTKTLLDSSSF
jgi:hypothetical protein